jgi:hypothetical protein
VIDLNQRTLVNLVPEARVDILVTDGSLDLERAAGVSVFLEGDPDAILRVGGLASLYSGIVITPTADTDLAAIREAIAPRLLLVSVPITQTDALRELGEIEGVRLNNFLTILSRPRSQFPTDQEWQHDMNVLSKVSANPNLVILVETALSPDEGDGSISVEQWQGYALASFLVGMNNSRSFFGLDATNLGAVPESPLFSIEIGTPLASPFRQNNVVQRRFTRGLVLVNPTDEPHAFALSRKYLDPDGLQIDSINMLPHTGTILVNAE